MAWKRIGISPVTTASGSDRYCRSIGGLPGHAIGKNGQPEQWTCYQKLAVDVPVPTIKEMLVGRTVAEAGELIFWAGKSGEITKPELDVLEDKYTSWKTGTGVVLEPAKILIGTSEERAIEVEKTTEFIKEREEIDIMVEKVTIPAISEGIAEKLKEFGYSESVIIPLTKSGWTKESRDNFLNESSTLGIPTLGFEDVELVKIIPAPDPAGPIDSKEIVYTYEVPESFTTTVVTTTGTPTTGGGIGIGVVIIGLGLAFILLRK